MAEPLSRFLEALSDRSGRRTGAKKKRTTDLGREIVQLLDVYDEIARASLQPLTPEQKAVLESLVREATEGARPSPEDIRAVDKLLLHLTMAADEEGEDGVMCAFVLGMAYERLKTKPTLLAPQP
ncbi:MAG: hypothetical protein HYX99_00010 [Chloroflexi bacterium]|nr:hypothetical protein [Chloroflexota bacterium]